MTSLTSIAIWVLLFLCDVNSQHIKCYDVVIFNVQKGTDDYLGAAAVVVAIVVAVLCVVLLT